MRPICERQWSSIAAVALVVICASTVVTACGRTENIAVENPMNVLLITIDTLRSDHLGCYGYEQDISPNIDMLANRGILFERTISQSSVTPVSHASILTGQNPYRHGVRSITGGAPHKLARDHATLSNLLQHADYRTAAFISAMTLEKRRYGLDGGFEVYEQSFYGKGAEDLDQGKQGVDTRRSQNLAQRRADTTTNLAVDWLRQTAGQPFFLWVHYFDPHETFLIPPILPGVLTYTIDGPLADVDARMYDIEIKFVDLMIGYLIGELFNHGVGHNTLIVLTSDHGQGLGDHNYHEHGMHLYQEQIHIPLILVGETLPKGIRLNVLARSIDIVPTVLDILGYPPQHIPDMDGTSLQPYWKGVGDASPQSMAYSESYYPKETYDLSPVISVIKGEWKLIYRSEAEKESELYNLTEDPLELDNVFLSEPERSREFIELISRLQGDSNVVRMRADEDLDEETRKLLKSLGYLD